MVPTIFTELDEVEDGDEDEDEDDDDKEVKVSIIEEFPNTSLVSLIILGCFLWVNSRFDATAETLEVKSVESAAVELLSSWRSLFLLRNFWISVSTAFVGVIEVEEEAEEEGEEEAELSSSRVGMINRSGATSW